jgi:lipopolysaccharide export system protein LptA
MAARAGRRASARSGKGRDDYVEGEGERIVYNSNSEVAELFHRAWVKSGEDQIRGDYIWYDAVSEKYLVTAGDKRAPKDPPARVRAIIQPKAALVSRKIRHRAASNWNSRERQA